MFVCAKEKEASHTFVHRPLQSRNTWCTEKATDDSSSSSYNEFKCGVDVMDQMVTKYSCKRRTRRWPLAFFYNIIDIAALATYVVHTELATNPSKSTDARRKFLHSLARDLIQNQMEERMNNPHVMRQKNTRVAIEQLFGGRIEEKSTNPVPGPPPSRLPKSVQGSCKLCWAKDKIQRKTRQKCCTCELPVCAVHSTQYYQCIACAE